MLRVWLTLLPLLLAVASCGEEAVQPPASEIAADSNSELLSTPHFRLAASPDTPTAKQQLHLDPHAIARRAAPAVVLVACKQSETTISQGTGFHIGGGYIVTNFHVVAGCSAIGVKPSGGTFSIVRAIAAYNAEDDIAVLAVDDFPTVARLVLAAGSRSEPGDAVVVIGNPLGLELSVSNGIIAARREIAGKPYVQITAPISPGSSGGPVLDDRGKVIGVATLTRVGGQALNFAVDAATVRAVLPRSGAPEIPVAEFGLATRDTADATTDAPPAEGHASPGTSSPPEFPAAVAGFAFGMTLDQARSACTDYANWDARRRGLRWSTALRTVPNLPNVEMCPSAPEPLDFVAATVSVVIKAGQVVRIGFIPTSWEEALRKLSAKYGPPVLGQVNDKNEPLPPGRLPDDRPLVWLLRGGFLRLFPRKSPLVLYVSDADGALDKQGY